MRFVTSFLVAAATCAAAVGFALLVAAYPWVLMVVVIAGMFSIIWAFTHAVMGDNRKRKSR